MSSNSIKQMRVHNLNKWFLDKAIPQKEKSYISQLKNGKTSFGEKVARRLEETYGMPKFYLDLGGDKSNASLSGTIDDWDSNTPLNDDDIEVPFYKDIRLSAGNGFAEDIEDYNGFKLRLSKSTMRRHNIDKSSVVCLTVDGNSMQPVFKDGSTVGIDRSDTNIKDGKIYAFNHDGLLRVKVLERLPANQVRIKSYNPEYDDEIDSIDNITILGRVWWSSSIFD